MPHYINEAAAMHYGLFKRLYSEYFCSKNINGTVSVQLQDRTQQSIRKECCLYSALRSYERLYTINILPRL